MLVNLKYVLDMAEKGNFAIPAFNVYNMESVIGVLKAAEEMKAPIIMQVYPRLMKEETGYFLSPVIMAAAEKASVPVCFHLDHGPSELESTRSIRYGATGIMLDGSTLPFEENIALTKRVVKTCAHLDVQVEGELGHVGSTADSDMDEFTTPEDAKRLVEETGVLCLAVAVGTAHGRYKKPPKLDIDRIKDIRKATNNADLVLHGGSGVPDEEIKKAVKAGIRKMNFATDICYSFLDTCLEELQKPDRAVAIDTFMKKPIEAVKDFCVTRIKLVGADGNPDDWVSATCENISGVLKKSGISSDEICAVSLDAATHTAVIMDENFNVIRPAIYWTDTRSTEEVAYLKENYGEIIDNQVLHKADTIWSLPEILWIKNNESENWKKIRKILFAKDYVRHQLTGNYVTDYIEAEGSMMFDINKMEWSRELCGVLGIDTEIMPKIVKPTDIVGKITADAEKLTGLKAGTPVLCGTTDTVMEVFASGAVKKGQMTLKLATAGRICVITDKPHPDVNLINYSHIIDGHFYPGTATKSCAASYRWYRDTFGGDYGELDKMAESVGIGSDGLVFHPYLNGELTPYANPNLCADFVGVRASHTKAHFTRAVLEGVTMSMLDCKCALDNMNIPHDDKAVIIGGGGKSPLWRQMIADALGIELIEMKYADSSFGSAMLAGIATGIFESAEIAVEKCNEIVSMTKPNMENNEKYKELFKKYKAMQKALETIYNGEY